MSDQNLIEKKKESTEVFRGRMLHAFCDTVILPNGSESTREYLIHGGAVCIVPLTENGTVVMERQFRYPVGRVVLEIPAGKLDSPDEDPLEAGKRELREETGLTADEWILLGRYMPAPAYSSEDISIYLAKGLHQGERHLDDEEFLDVVEIPLEDLVRDVLDGKIIDGKTQVAIMKTSMLLR